jgi:SAM-dependent methyltransferase
MTNTQKASRVRRVISAVGVLPLAFTVWRTVRDWNPGQVTRNRQARRKAGGDYPVPPGSLLLETGGTRDVNWYLTSGKQTADSFRHALDRIGRPITSFSSVLDFGCGVGRVLRQWSKEKGPTFQGCDYNPRLVSWDRKNLPVQVKKNELAPPLPYSAESFDLCYAVSVFTHLPEDLQEPWLREMHRVLRSNGILIVTLSGDGDLNRLTDDEQARFRSGEIVVIDGKYAGSNMCGVYHPEAYVRTKWSHLFQIVDYCAEGAKGSPRQDLYVLEKVN